jgi:hypothetical protein
LVSIFTLPTLMMHGQTQIKFNTGVNFVGCHVILNEICTTWNML